MLKAMKHVCPYCGRDLEGTELGIHINTLEDKAANPVSDPQLETLQAELETLKATLAVAPATDAAQASALTLPHFG